jgi:hypothetical protein
VAVVGESLTVLRMYGLILVKGARGPWMLCDTRVFGFSRPEDLEAVVCVSERRWQTT